MLVPDLLGLKVLLVLGIVELLEDVLEATIVLLKDGILGTHVEGQALVKSKLEGGMSKASNGLVSVVLRLGNATTVLELVDLDLLRLATFRGVNHGQLAWSGGNDVLGAVLVAKGMATNNNGLFPTGDQTRDTRDDDGLTEDSAAQSISNCAVW